MVRLTLLVWGRGSWEVAGAELPGPRDLYSSAIRPSEAVFFCFFFLFPLFVPNSVSRQGSLFSAVVPFPSIAVIIKLKL